MADDWVDRVANDMALGRAVDWEAAIDGARNPKDRQELEALRLVQQMIQLVPAAASVNEAADTAPAPLRPAPLSESNTRSSARKEWGRYRLVQEVGSGGFGTVYRAFDPALNLDIAIKILHRHVSDDLLKERLLNEGRTLAKIRHQNVVRVLSVEFDSDSVGLCTEFILGDTIENEVRSRGTFSESQAIEVGKALCQALAAVHRAGFVHRDVKARNTMRERDTGRIVLMDFGTGRDVADELSSARRGIEGTLLYLAPEILTGLPASFSSDVYSVGVLLYYVLTGAYPTEGNTLDELKAAHLKGQRSPLGDRRPDLSPAFVRVVELALALKQHRYATPGALCAALEEIASERRPAWRKHINRTAAGLFAGVSGLALLGFINTTYLDAVLGLKEFTLVYSPFDHRGLWGWIQWGRRAMLAPAILLSAAALVLTLVFECKRLVSRVSPRFREIERSAAVLAHRWSLHEIDVLSSLSLWLSAVVLLGTSWYFAPLLGTLTSVVPDLSTVSATGLTLLSPDYNDYHVLYREAYVATTIACVILWYPVVRLAIRTRQAVPRRIAVGGVLVVMFSVAILDFPYRLLYHTDFDEVTWSGNSCHLIGTRGDERLIFCPDLEPPRTKPVPAASISMPQITNRSLLRFIQRPDGTPRS